MKPVEIRVRTAAQDGCIHVTKAGVITSKNYTTKKSPNPSAVCLIPKATPYVKRKRTEKYERLSSTATMRTVQFCVVRAVSIRKKATKTDNTVMDYT